MLAYKDFVPEFFAINGGTKDIRTAWQLALSRADSWVQESGIQILNIETVALPSYWVPEVDDALDKIIDQSKIDLQTKGLPAAARRFERKSSHWKQRLWRRRTKTIAWYQVIRIWYEVPPAGIDE